MLPIRVLHVASHHINVGDGALVHGIKQYLRAAADRPIAYTPLDIASLGAADSTARFDHGDLADYELVLVGGGGTIDGSRRHRKSGMAMPLSGDEIRRSPARIAFVALGYNLFPGETLHCRDALVDVLRACRERGFPFSVRNDSSHERLVAAVGAAARDVVEVPDPGFFVQPDRHYIVPQMTGRRPSVVVQVAGDNLEKRLGGTRRRRWFGRTPRRTNRAFAHALANVVTWLITRHGAEVVMAPHITRDLALTGQIIDRLPASLARRHVRVLGVAHPDHAPQFFQAYAQADLVVGMRGHSVIAAVGLRVPCVAISTHAKVVGFMQKCGLQRWSLPWSDDMEAALHRTCQQLLDDPRGYLQSRDAATSDFHDRFARFMATVCSGVAARPGGCPQAAA